MRNKNYASNIALAVVLGLALAACQIAKVIAPLGVLPKLDIPNMVLLALFALLCEHYIAPSVKRIDILMPLFAALTFGLLPYAAGFATGMQALRLAVVGGIVFTVTAWLYASVQERLSSGPVAKAAPVFSALGLYLAVQCFSGMIL